MTSDDLLAALDHDTEIHELPLPGGWTLRLVVRDGYLDSACWRVGGAWWPVLAGEA